MMNFWTQCVAAALAAVLSFASLGVNMGASIDGRSAARTMSLHGVQTPTLTHRSSAAVSSVRSLLRAAARSIDPAVPEPLRQWVASEQKLLSRKMAAASVIDAGNVTDHRFTPESGSVFELPSYWVDEDTVRVFTSDVPASLHPIFFRESQGRRQVRFFVHPESRSAYESQGLARNVVRSADRFLATPTSSSRSLVVWPERGSAPPFIAKVSLDVTTWGANRMIGGDQVARSVGVDQLLRRASKLPSSFDWFREPIGIIPSEMARGGMIIREVPESMLGDMSYLPFFSWYADTDSGTSLVKTLIESEGMSYRHFAENLTVRPFVEQWQDLVDKHGMIAEPHAQNFLMGIDASGVPNGQFMHRDLGGFTPDLKKIGTDDVPVYSTLEETYKQSTVSDRGRNNLWNYFGRRALENLDAHMVGFGDAQDRRAGVKAFTTKMQELAAQAN